MDIKIIYEDKYLLVLVKGAGILTHPTAANEKNTLTNWFIQNYPNFQNLSWPDKNRPGIVHRLDKDTSGLIIVAKNPNILTKLQEQFKQRRIQKTYLALVCGKMKSNSGKIEASILRGPAGMQQVRQFTVFETRNLRPAITYWEVLSEHRFKNSDLTLLKVTPKTGRMHQIRTHLKYFGTPIIGDPLYNTKFSRSISKDIGLTRQFLHAHKLEFDHPENGQLLKFDSDLPNDLKNIMLKI